jgi:hypothetical protein
MPSPSTHRSTVNQNTQIGIETTPGTIVPANRLLEAFSVKFGVKADVKTFRAQGRKYPSVAVENTEMTEGSFSGELDYIAIIYLIHCMIAPVTLTLHAPSTTVSDWGPISPALSGNYSPKTFSIEHGDSIRAEKAGYGLFTGLNYKIVRKEALTLEAPFMAQQITDNITMTATPTIVALSPAVGKHFNIYLDPTSAAIGSTLLLNPMELSYSSSDYYTQFWPIVRANASWISQIDQAPKVEVKLTIEADSAGMSPLTQLQTGAYLYMRVDAVGPIIDIPNSINASFRHDMALKVTNIADFSDKDGVYATEYTMMLAEDSGWSGGTAQKFSGTAAIITSAF